MAQRKPLVIGAAVPIEAIQTGDTLDAKVQVSAANVVLGRVTSGAGEHEEINIADLPMADFSDPQTIVSEIGTTYTLELADAGAMVCLNNPNPITLEIPTNASVAFPIGTHVDLIQEGDGQVTVTPLSGVTLRSRNGTKLGGKYAGGTLFKRAENEWYLFGDITT